MKKIYGRATAWGRSRYSVVGRRVLVEQDRTAAQLAQAITGIAQRAVVDRQAAAADTAVELIAQLGEAVNPLAEHVAPDRRQVLPVVRGQGAPGR